MSTTPRRSDLKKLPKKDRRVLARELARIERERELARRRRNRRLGWTGAGLAVVAVGVVAVLVVQSSARAAHLGPKNMLSDGVVLTGDGSTVTATRTSALDPDTEPTPTVVDRSSGALDLVLYLDYRSPQAQTFWAANGDQIDSWVTQGLATLELHPVAVLDDAAVAAPTPTAAASPAPTAPSASIDTTGDYSVRAANALACVADTVPDNALSVHQALIGAQPDLGAAGLTDDQLADLVRGTGITNTTVTDCLSDHSFEPWVRDATDRAADSVGATDAAPVLMVAGERYTGSLDDNQALVAFITEVSEQLAAESSPAPTATPTPTTPTDRPTAQ